MIEFAVCLDGSSPARNFLADELESVDRAKMRGLIERLGDHGEIHNIQRFRYLKKTSLCELKIFKYRILCFRDGDAWVLTHGFKKKADSTPPSEIARGERIMAEDLSRLQ